MRRVNLSTLRDQDPLTPGWELLGLILDEPAGAIARACRMLVAEPPEPRLAETIQMLNLIGPIIVYKLPRSSR